MYDIWAFNREIKFGASGSHVLSVHRSPHATSGFLVVWSGAAGSFCSHSDAGETLRHWETVAGCETLTSQLLSAMRTLRQTADPHTSQDYDWVRNHGHKCAA